MIRIVSGIMLAVFLALSASAETFTPRSYISRVLAASPAMRQAEQNFIQAEETYRGALLDAALPSFSLNLSDSFYNQDRHAPRASRGDVESSLSAYWNLYDSASSPLSKIKTARLNYEYARLTLLTAKEGHAVAALGKFYALYSTQQKILAAKTNLDSRERQYRDTNEQFQSGTRSKIEVTQSEGDKLQSELSLAQAESAAAKALMAFNELLNAEPEAAEEVVIDTGSVNIKLPLPKDDLARALENNFSLRLKRNALERTRLANHNAVMTDYPRLKVDADWAKRDLGILGIPGGAWRGGQSYSLGASVSFPFGFFGAQNYFDVKGQHAALKAAELDLEDAVRSLKTSVLSAQKDVELQVKSRQLLDFQVKAQKDTTDNLLTEYSLGGASFLQLDSSQTKMLDASNNQITAINDLDLAIANYRVLLGEKIWE